MAQQHVIELALDLSRMPALTQASAAPPIPANIIELMRIAAGSSEACEAAVAETGEPTAVVIEAARFYLQHALFRPEADCYRILGIGPNASRATARDHMRWLLQWLHPDRNHNSLDGVFAERVLKAWHEVSASNGAVVKPNFSRVPGPFDILKRAKINSVRLPWIDYSTNSQSPAIRSSYRTFIMRAVWAGVVILFLVLWSTMIFLRP